MREPRLKAGVEVRALLRLAAGRGHFATLRRRGDEEAGGILLVLRTHGGEVMVISRIQSETGGTAWLAAAPAPLGEEEAERRIERETGRDPDLWVIEIEGPDLFPAFLGRILF